MARRVKKWKYRSGAVEAYERGDRDNAIYGRVWNGKEYERNRRLTDPIRDIAGNLVPALVNAAEDAARLFDNSLALAAAGKPEAPASDAPVTLAVGFYRALHPDGGMYADNKTRWAAMMRTYAKSIQSILGSAVLFDDLRRSHYRTVWRSLARQYRDNKTGGYRTTEQHVDLLQSVANWLAAEEIIGRGSALSGRWRDRLKADWSDITDEPIKAPEKPRADVSREQKLFDALDDADPRLAMAVEIGAEMRLGQLPRSRRSDIGAWAGVDYALVTVHGRGNKRGEVVVLTAEQRTRLINAITVGYLADLETAYAAGDLDDYYIITGGRLKMTRDERGRITWRAQIKNAGKRLGETGLRKQWSKLETAAGVEHVDGMGWYGLRRLGTDKAEKVGKGQTKALNKLGGWKDTKTRESYQDTGNIEHNIDAAKIRAKIRPKRRRRSEPVGGWVPATTRPALIGAE